MSIMHINNLSKSQSGSTLIVSLVILVLLMLLGITAMNASDTQNKLAANLQFEDAAMNNAETAMNVGEIWLKTALNFKNSGFTTYSTNSPEIYPIGGLTGLTSPANDPLTMTWSNSNSVEPSANQRYIIEKMSDNSRLVGSNQSMGGRTSTGCNQVNTYRVTARGESRRGAIKFVQSFFSVLSC